jgi:hypothetical protein
VSHFRGINNLADPPPFPKIISNCSSRKFTFCPKRPHRPWAPFSVLLNE